MEKWMVAARKADFNRLAETFSISPVLARIMVNRGLKEDEDFRRYLYGDLGDLHDGSLLKDMNKGIRLLRQAISEGQLICIASDFDVDGVFSGYILWQGIRMAGGRAYVIAPDRIHEGYGLNERIVGEAHSKGAGCIITCDNGIAAMEAVTTAKELGMTVIITDHHEVIYQSNIDENGNVKKIYELPEADAVIDPKQEDCPYPFDGLCGAGVAFKVIEQLYMSNGIPKENLYELLPFTAIATVADVMDLVDENRIIVKYGLHRLAKTPHLGLQSLIRHCGLNKEYISAYNVGFVIGPCFNAAGRLDTAQMAEALLQTEDREEAERMAADLVSLNQSRKEMTVLGYEQALEKIAKEEIYKDKIMILCLEDCHESLVGIIAGRLKEKYYRPVIVGTEANGIIKASGRSIEAYNMYEGLSECRDLFERFGGHAMAAGMSLKVENLEILRRRLNEKCGLTEESLMPVVHIDVPMPLEYISEGFVQELELLEPFGKGNSKPIFAERHFNILRASVIGKNKNVLKMIVKNDSGVSMEALYFGDIAAFDACVEAFYGLEARNKMYAGLPNPVDMAFTYYPSINEFGGRRTLQITVQHFQRIQR
ncbi:MAG: single-stranded-DNA-specific exonuclease RecJ [Clostridia bacterium]|nr:single-stranded-DNA-specific exonuclease RecJ [Lachnospiraceae bacterium]NCB99099.1 single-stranded-DNA-specific exonuclease RecJ [Clostridia bacterium]NCD02155.1 single-stranded-DNA-specific exonuclease RecJ [Clostridia bacterium]